MRSGKGKVFLTIVAITMCPWVAALAKTVDITMDLSVEERAAVARMFKSLSELAVENEQVSEKEQHRLAAELMRSLGVIARTSARDADSGELGLDIEKLFNAIGVLVELGEEAAGTAAERRAASDLMRTIGAVAAAHTDADHSAVKAPIKDLFDSLANLIAQGTDDPEAEKRFASQFFFSLGAVVEASQDDNMSPSQKKAVTNLFASMGHLIAQGDDPEDEKRFASQLFLALGALVAEEGNDGQGASKDSLSVDSAASQLH